MNSQQNRRYMTPQQVSEHFGGTISVRTLANWRSQQVGPAYTKVGGRVLYPTASIAEWEQKRTVGGTGQYRA
jgi:hypothetical protein